MNLYNNNNNDGWDINYTTLAVSGVIATGDVRLTTTNNSNTGLVWAGNNTSFPDLGDILSSPRDTLKTEVDVLKGTVKSLEARVKSLEVLVKAQGESMQTLIDHKNIARRLRA